MTERMFDYEVANTCQIRGLSEIYFGVFGRKTDGFFVEAGAYNGYDFSNIWGLANLGWYGLLIEPFIPEYNNCVKRYAPYKNINVLRSAVGEKPEVRKLHVSNASAINTLSVQERDLISSLDWGKKLYTGNTVEVPVDSLNNILATYYDFFGVFRSIDVLSLDVEGSEIEALKGFDLVEFHPKLCLVETHENNKDYVSLPHAKFVDEYFLKNWRWKYLKIYADEINTIYLRVDY